jgi:protein phosphatase-4 regulatory subunit 3
MDVDRDGSGSTKTGVHVNGQSSRQGSTPPEDGTDEGINQRREVVFLIQQLCVMGKNVQLPARMSLFRTLVDRGILFAVQWALSFSEKDEVSKQLISAGGEILACLLDHDIHGVRGHVLKQVGAIEKEKKAGKEGADKAETVLALMCRMLASSQDLAVQCQVGDALRTLLDIPPNDSEAQVRVRHGFYAYCRSSFHTQTVVGVKLLARMKDEPGIERFLDYFYKQCIETLFRPFQDVPDFKNLTSKLGNAYHLIDRPQMLIYRSSPSFDAGNDKPLPISM